MRIKKEKPLSYSDRLDFIGLSDESFDDGIELWAAISPEMDGILKAFYAHLLRLAPKQISKRLDVERVSQLQKQHWKLLFTSFYSEDYVKTAHRIGYTHAAIGLSAEWYISGYVYLLNNMTEVLLDRYADKPDLAKEKITLLNRLVGLDMSTVMSAYHED